MKNTYPVKLSPIYKQYIWGGTRLKEDFGKGDGLDTVAESWELSAHKDGESVIATGEYAGMRFSEYINALGVESIGTRAEGFDRFPILIKLIDACSDLSVQVHPSDEYAERVEGELGKSEMWYVLDACEGATLFYGFKRDVSREEVADAIKDGRLCDLLNRVSVKRGNVFYIPAGMVHAIGSGILIAEIQQNSNTTYRVYDYGRRDKDGHERPLHIEKALDVADLTAAPEIKKTSDGDNVLLAECEYFSVRRIRVNGKSKAASGAESFVSFLIIEGCGRIECGGISLDAKKGDSIFVPACAGEIKLYGDLEIIESRMGEKKEK